MNLVLTVKGVSLGFELTPAELTFPDDSLVRLAGVSLSFEQTGADIVFPEQFFVLGVSLVEVDPSPTQVRRRRLIF